jgi:hypothetical protein
MMSDLLETYLPCNTVEKIKWLCQGGPAPLHPHSNFKILLSQAEATITTVYQHAVFFNSTIVGQFYLIKVVSGRKNIMPPTSRPPPRTIPSLQKLKSLEPLITHFASFSNDNFIWPLDFSP